MKTIEDLEDQRENIQHKLNLVDLEIREFKQPLNRIGLILKTNHGSDVWTVKPEVTATDYNDDDTFKVDFDFSYRTTISGGVPNTKGCGDLVSPSQAMALYNELGIIITCVGDDYLYLRKIK